MTNNAMWVLYPAKVVLLHQRFLMYVHLILIPTRDWSQLREVERKGVRTTRELNRKLQWSNKVKHHSLTKEEEATKDIWKPLNQHHLLMLLLVTEVHNLYLPQL